MLRILVCGDLRTTRYVQMLCGCRKKRLTSGRILLDYICKSSLFKLCINVNILNCLNSLTYRRVEPFSANFECVFVYNVCSTSTLIMGGYSMMQIIKF